MNKRLIIVYSYHHKNTEKIAHVMADVLGAEVKRPDEVNSEEIQASDLLGLGAGIDSGKHYQPLLEFAKNLEDGEGKKVFVFSTSAILGEKKVANDHNELRNILMSKGYRIIDEFSCKGYNTNHFLKYIGGMNRGRPNEKDVENAKEFALKIERRLHEAGALGEI